MMLSANTIIRNATVYDYPFIESCMSVLPVCDELVILCDPTSEDDTVEVCERFADEHDAVRLHLSDWWNSDRHIWALSDATNEAISLCTGDYFLCIQADEVLKEASPGILRNLVDENEADIVEFGHLHFWGSFDRIISRHEKRIRMARKRLYPTVRSFEDGAMLSTSLHNEYVPFSDTEFNVCRLAPQVSLFHYGSVRETRAFYEKQIGMAGLRGWGGADPVFTKWIEDHHADFAGQNPNTEVFTGEHPECAREWIASRAEILKSWTT